MKVPKEVIVIMQEDHDLVYPMAFMSPDEIGENTLPATAGIYRLVRKVRIESRRVVTEIKK